MPYKHIEKKIPKALDRRRKLSVEEVEEIKKNYGKISQRKLAKLFNVSRRLVTFIGCPAKKERDLEMRALRGGSKIYYDKDRWCIIMKKHRHYKQKLMLEGKLE